MRKNPKLSRLAKKRIILESLVAFLILTAPFIFKSHEYFPGDSTESVNLFFFQLGANGFESVETHAWFIVGKLVPFYLLILWFLTCKHWWYHIILIPITMYAFQLFELYYSEDDVIDSENILWLLPVCMVVIPFVYFIRVKLYDKHVHGIDLKAMDEELQILKAKEELRKEREKLEQRKETLSKKL
ncbi:hypothetical protein [uncultured Croceitalea sp.]|uniref:hypothetical protein n=1 Tax=uncultured Croceitalea sp. TaxID=1798908 RepID=UPI0033059A6C